MKGILSSVYLALAACVGSAIASGSWAGTNLYFLQGMSEEDQNAYIDKLSGYNTKVVRLWVNGQSQGCQKGSNIRQNIPALETTLGQYNNETLDAVDKVLVKLANKNIKAIISPHDANSLIGDYRKDVYYDRWGAGYFYEQQDAFDAYDARLSYILNYKGEYSGKVWKDWPHAIVGFNIQNEPMTPSASHCQNNDPHGWACGRAQKLRSLLGNNHGTLVTTGGLGGDISHNCNFNTAVTQCDAIDAIAIHRYASVPGQWSDQTSGWINQANGKKVYVEEWGIDKTKYDQPSSYDSEVDNFNSGGLPQLYWQILPPASDSCPYDPSNDSGDHFGIFDNSGTDFKGRINGATGVGAAQDWTGSVY